MVCWHAPTRAASREDKDAFFEQLDSTISSVPSGEIYVLLEDSNAGVRSSNSFNDQWSNVRGPLGLGATSNFGKELLFFLSLHQATVCNI